MTKEQMEHVESIVSRCEFPDYTFGVQLDGRGECYLQASYWEPDTETDEVGMQLTRRWFLSPEMTPSEIVQTVFKCVMTSREHSIREWFRFKGQAVYGPHFDVEALVQLCKDGKFSNRTLAVGKQEVSG